jgi:hypothetical protein
MFKLKKHGVKGRGTRLAFPVRRIGLPLVVEWRQSPRATLLGVNGYEFVFL